MIKEGLAGYTFTDFSKNPLKLTLSLKQSKLTINCEFKFYAARGYSFDFNTTDFKKQFNLNTTCSDP